MFATHDTIVAIATPAGRGGIGVVRVSGPDAVAVARALLGPTTVLEARRATFARVSDLAQPGGIVDQVVATWFPAPHSYTGEHVVEIAGHGSPLLLRRIIEFAVAGGARLAEPGEFTLRAYLNGRIDLIQAEAVADLVDAVTPLQARVAIDQLEGTLTTAIARVDAELLDLSARLEASLDFPDEGFHFITLDDLQAALERIRSEIVALISQGRAGRVVREGRMVAITGAPNAGKSSLFNALAGAARAIVTELPGTTRDLLTERIDVEGVPITLVDTAGLREANDAIEAEGIARARQARAAAALTLLVLDRSRPLQPIDGEQIGRIGSDVLVVVNKIDLPAAWGRELLPPAAAGAIEISSKTGAGLDALRRALVAALIGREELRDQPAISNLRHLGLLEDARLLLERARTAVDDGATEELVLVDVIGARQKLEELTGRRAPDDLLAHIFGRFCVGK